MNARISLIALGVAATLAAGSALAHGGMGHGSHGPTTPDQVAQRMTPLKEALKLQPNQVAAWGAFEAKARSNIEVRAKMREGMVERRGNADAMAEYRVTMMKSNAQAAEEMLAVRKALVAVLTPEQKATFDNFRPGPTAGGSGGPGHGPGHHQGGGHGYGHGPGSGPGYGPGGGMRGGCMSGQV